MPPAAADTARWCCPAPKDGRPCMTPLPCEEHAATGPAEAMLLWGGAYLSPAPCQCIHQPDGTPLCRPCAAVLPADLPGIPAWRTRLARARTARHMERVAALWRAARRHLLESLEPAPRA